MVKYTNSALMFISSWKSSSLTSLEFFYLEGNSSKVKLLLNWILLWSTENIHDILSSYW